MNTRQEWWGTVRKTPPPPPPPPPCIPLYINVPPQAFTLVHMAHQFNLVPQLPGTIWNGLELWGTTTTMFSFV